MRPISIALYIVLLYAFVAYQFSQRMFPGPPWWRRNSTYTNLQNKQKLINVPFTVIKWLGLLFSVNTSDLGNVCLCAETTTPAFSTTPTAPAESTTVPIMTTGESVQAITDESKRNAGLMALLGSCNTKDESPWIPLAHIDAAAANVSLSEMAVDFTRFLFFCSTLWLLPRRSQLPQFPPLLHQTVCVTLTTVCVGGHMTPTLLFSGPCTVTVSLFH